MKFTILTQYYQPEVGAAQTRLAAFARELCQHGHQVQIVTAMPNYPSGVIEPEYRGKLQVWEKIDGIPILRMWIYPATGKRVIKRLANYLSFMFLSLLGLMQVPRSDILFVESPPLFLCVSAWLLAKLRKEKLIINISDLWPDSVVALGFMSDSLFIRSARLLERWLYNRAWRICGVTDGVVEGIIQKCNSPDKVMLLPNGVDTEFFQPLSSIDERSRPKQFLYAGTHGYAHGVDVILYAAHTLKQRRDIEFLLVGDGAEKPRLCKLADELQLPNLKFLEPVPLTQMPSLLNESYVALVTVTGGAFFSGTRSAKLFPAMAMGRAILHSGYGEGAKLVQSAQCGIVTPPGDVDAFVDAVLTMVEHPEEVDAMGRYGRTFVIREYSWNGIVSRWLKTLGISET